LSHSAAKELATQVADPTCLAAGLKQAGLGEASVATPPQVRGRNALNDVCFPFLFLVLCNKTSMLHCIGDFWHARRTSHLVILHSMLHCKQQVERVLSSRAILSSSAPSSASYLMLCLPGDEMRAMEEPEEDREMNRMLQVSLRCVF